MYLVLTLLALSLPAEASEPSQFDVEAVYLFNFAKFVRWPSGTEHEILTICIAGQRSIAEVLPKVIDGERIGSRPLAIRSVQRPEQSAGCNILFIGNEAKGHLGSLLSSVAGTPTLTVSDMPEFLDSGGMIVFEVIDKRVRFSVNLVPVGASGISLSSDLLKVAVVVKGGPPRGGTE